ncbi:transposase [Komagataeibacter medellinensis NBRC 3288]|uniref:Transposase n=1 Tax=Komagataeibacter medellinensis (strain NBRC 3288 / BCRC 11682 / LMG 1693 / Kondo 51) TaxID=634177 RepID=G2I2G8_KOMMN|nr:transposase [Komagataeibacter medellinensis NBRC 3288]
MGLRAVWPGELVPSFCLITRHGITTAKIRLSLNVGLIFLASRVPAQNPVKNVWQFSSTPTGCINAACSAWNNLAAFPGTIRSIGRRKWCHKSQRR